MPRILLFVCLGLCILACACKDGGGIVAGGGIGGGLGMEGDDDPDAGLGAEGGSAGAGGVGGAGGIATECKPGALRDCYSGPVGTADIGVCTFGSEECLEDGSEWGPCLGEVIPEPEAPTPPGETPVDEDCDGMTDEPS